MALVTLSQLKAKLGITVTTYDDDLTAVIAGASALVRSYLGYDPEATGTQTEYLSPLGGELLTLRKVPPRAPVTLAAVYEDYDTPPVFDADTLLTSGTDYAQQTAGSNAIVRLNRNWHYDVRRMPDRLGRVFLPDTGTVKVTYTFDLTDHLAVAKRAALVECMAEYNATYAGAGVGLVTSDSMDGASVTINTNAKTTGRKQNSADGFTSPLVAGWLDPFRATGII